MTPPSPLAVGVWCSLAEEFVSEQDCTHGELSKQPAIVLPRAAWETLLAAYEACKREAQAHDMERATQASIVRECYEAVGAGRPGDWIGAELVRAYVAGVEQRIAEAVAKEREACAVTALSLVHNLIGPLTAVDVAAAIRDRGAASAFPPYDPTFGNDRACHCGHEYYRHFDTYDQMLAVGCKYCQCGSWMAP